jgi:hypothetical protein
MRIASRRCQVIGMGALGAVGLGLAAPAHAALVTLFTTQDDFSQSGWANGGGSPAVSFGASGAFDADGSTTNGLGNLTNAGGTGTAGSLQVNTGTNAIGYTYTVFSPNELNNQAFMSAFDPGSTAGSTVPYSGNIYVSFSVPSFVGPDVYYQVGIDLAYPGDGYYGLSFSSSTSQVGSVITATIPYTIVASSGGSLTISPSFNAGVYGSGVSGTSNVLTAPIYFDNFQVTAVPEPASIGLLGAASLLTMRRRRRA